MIGDRTPVVRPGRNDEGPLALLRGIVSVFGLHKFKIFAWTAFCAGCAALYALTMPPSFTATGTLLLQRLGGSEGQASAQVLDLNRADSELQILKSERLLTQVFETLDLADDPEFKRGIPGELGRQIAFADFSQRLKVRRVGQSYVIEVSYSSSNAALAPRVVNAALSAYLLQSILVRSDAARNGAERVQGRVDALQEQVSAASAAIKSGTLPSSATPDADGRVIGAAQRPLIASSPRPALIMALGGLLGVLSAIFVIGLASSLDRRVRGARQVTRDAGFRYLATLPASDSAWRRWGENQTAASLVLTQPQGKFSKSIRELRTSLKLASSSGPSDGHQVIAVVSWSPHAGSGLVAKSLANLIGHTSRVVTLIETDVLARDGAVPPTAEPAVVTLSQVLQNETPAVEIVFANIEGVCALPARRSNALPADTAIDFCDPHLVQLVDYARSKGDVLIVLPPLSTAPDGRALAKCADAVVIVADVRRNTIDELIEAGDLLASAGVAVTGVVLNHAGGAGRKLAIARGPMDVFRR